MAPAALTSALSSMEMMLEALRQRGYGKPEETSKPKEEEPPVLPSRPTVRGRRPAQQRPGGTAAAPWMTLKPSPPSTPPSQEEDEEKCLVNKELEKRAAKAEEDVKQKEEEMKQKEELISTLQRKIVHYESRLSECAVRMKSVEEELQRQITSLQMARTPGGRTDGSTKHSHRASSSRRSLRPPQPSRRQQCDDSEPDADVAAAAANQQCDSEPAGAVATAADEQCDSEPDAAAEERASLQAEPVNQEAREMEIQMEREPPERVVVVEEIGPPSPSGAKSLEELKMMKRHFAEWKKEYEAKLKKTRVELKKLVHAEKKSGGGDGHAHQRRRCGWFRIKAPKCRVPMPKCGAFKLPSAKSCCCCCRR